MDTSLVLKCNFCGKKYGAHEPFLPGGTKDNMCSICLQCLKSGKSLLENRMQAQIGGFMLEELAKNLPSPKEIHAFLNQYVISQEETKKILSVAVYTHYKRLSYMLSNTLAEAKKMEALPTAGNINGKANVSASKVGLGGLKKQEAEDIELEKSNILLIGPTGCGKTLLASTLAKMVNVPFAIADATTLTEAGYVGDDVENILLRLLQNAEYNVPWAEKGIIFLDEIDKIGRKSENSSITRDVSGEGVQQALLKIIEGTVANISLQGGRKHPQSETVAINTKNILFICGGAFNGIEEIVSRRQGTLSIGFKQFSKDKPASSKNKKAAALAKVSSDQNLVSSSITADDLTRFGLIPELVGRLPVVCKLAQLSGDALVEVLTKPKNALIKQYEKILSFENIKLQVEDSAYSAIVGEVEELKTGARGLRSILERTMLNVIYNADNYRGKIVTLNDEAIKDINYFAS